jgi:hypothetical protein
LYNHSEKETVIRESSHAEKRQSQTYKRSEKKKEENEINEMKKRTWRQASTKKCGVVKGKLARVKKTLRDTLSTD